MEAKKVKDRLSTMQGREFLRMGQNESIINFKVHEETDSVTIATNIRIYDKPLSGLESFLNSFLKIDKSKPPVNIKPMESKPVPAHLLERELKPTAQVAPAKLDVQNLTVTNPKGESNHSVQADGLELQVNGSVIKEVKDALLDSIRLVRQDRAFVPQANAIRETASTIIDLAKTELLSLKLQNELQGK